MATEALEATTETTTTDAGAAAADTDATATATAEGAVPPASTETPSTPAPVKPVVPEKYELVLPQDSALPVATIEKTAAIARELGLDNPAAQKVLDSFSAVLAADIAAEEKAWKPGEGSAWIARDAEWKADALKDAEIGGTPDKLAANVDKANLVIAKFFDPSVAEFLKVSGLGSKKEFIKGLAKIGRSMSEGTMVLGSPPAVSQKSHADILYGGTATAA